MTAIISLFVDDIRRRPRRDHGPCLPHPRSPTPRSFPVDAPGGMTCTCHLSDGPTAAFKDMAMQLLGELFPECRLTRRRLAHLG